MVLTEKPGTCEWKVNKISAQLAGVLQSNWGHGGTGSLPKAELRVPPLVVTVLGFAACLEKCDFWGFREESFLKSFTSLTTRNALFFQERKLEACSLCVCLCMCARVMYACVFVGVHMYMQVHVSMCVNVCVYMYLLGWLKVHSGFYKVL